MTQLTYNCLILCLMLSWSAVVATGSSYPSSCTSDSSNPQQLTCRGLDRSDWLTLASQSEPVWTALLVTDSPRLTGNSLWSDLSAGWRSRLKSMAIKDCRLDSLSLNRGKFELIEFPQLEALDLSGNRFVNIGDQATGVLVNISAPNLRSLQLGNNLWTELTTVDAVLIANRFPRLRLLDFTNSRLLSRLDFGFSDAVLSKLNELRDLRFNGCSKLARWNWAPAVRKFLSAGGSFSVKNTQSWNCSCESAWLAQLPPASLAGAACLEPLRLRGRSLAGMNFTLDPLLGCSAPQIANFSAKANYAIGDTARLLCRVAAAQPPASVTWTTNRGENATMKPELSHRYLTPSDTHANTFHSDHQWHWDSQYTGSKSEEGVGSGRIFVLRDASLYIDYVTRSDAGVYTCSADNGIGTGPVAMELVFTLKYEVLREVKKYGIIVGAACAASLLGIGFFIGLIRLIVRKCSEEERKRQNSIKEMLEHLESYRGAKMEQFKECKDSLRTCGGNQVGNYNARVGKVKEACINNMLHMQESYNRRIAKIRDHCDSQIERLRESYNCQMGRIKDYRSNQVERVRDQYNLQLLRIKEYASSQLDRLREQYKAQQAYLIKVLDSVSIDNCVSGATGMEEPDLKELGLDITPDLSDSEEAADVPGTSSGRCRQNRRYQHRAASQQQAEDGCDPLEAAEAAAAAVFNSLDSEDDEALEDFMTATDGALSMDRLDRLDEEDRDSFDAEAAAATGAVRHEVVQVEVLPAPEQVEKCSVAMS
ncbi:hypothetical protein BOX15_Mlig016652g1 [Macrostomum lignano]|uniref:Ig-like domain-containing protein n=1 Tax=Macrostomum lignano TaxID=282301 RepID=A0A267GQI6_9PLAT|nr:hypothetical protein BOX15_Mlig016652g1 [Macrostomum lignano]